MAPVFKRHVTTSGRHALKAWADQRSLIRKVQRLSALWPDLPYTELAHKQKRGAAAWCSTASQPPSRTKVMEVGQRPSLATCLIALRDGSYTDWNPEGLSRTMRVGHDTRLAKIERDCARTPRSYASDRGDEMCNVGAARPRAIN